ncbi:MAG: molybdenum cofactor guanylyltransferase [Betaproteobacteria bacterium]|nr:molybdenum cofactor guanylyltransferase [Betaproteobacteria bacterium]MDE2131660.1 molybdenum cofactor guanylyltransferase [Betaproteobacteria bacterium]MDE2211173.1 molybdenum cofactor guanylyltransferase [Betaproteobacteria bacterium]MDE2625031.1 molybdenum cofactor guanylyltransferase [Betaproteobacteria bacterium]
MSVVGCILAGGAGLRMGGQDKGLLTWQGRPLIESVIARFLPQVDTLVLSANRHLQQYQAYGYPVLADTEEGYAGPLAGIEQALRQAHGAHELVAIVPCDAPLLPLDLVARLHSSLAAADVDIAYAVTAGGDQPVFSLIKTSLLGSLSEYLRSGERKVQRWYGRCPCIAVPFDDQPTAFTNINTPDMLRNISQT